MLEWGSVAHEATAESDADFRARTTTAGEFTMSYKGEGVGADVYSFDGCLYISSAEDPEAAGAQGEIVLSCAQMDALALDWLRFRDHTPEGDAT